MRRLMRRLAASTTRRCRPVSIACCRCIASSAVPRKFGSSTSALSEDSFEALMGDKKAPGIRTSRAFITPQRTKRRGLGIVHDPIVNKGTGFSVAERDYLRIRGLVPPRQLDLETQTKKIYNAVQEQESDLRKALYINDLQDRNETAFFRLLIDHIEELAPIIYTPTVGRLCQRFGTQFRRSRGMYFSAEDKGMMGTMVHNWPHEDVEVIVVTDGSRILGLGDLGTNGMGIPIGKLALYCAAGGLHPRKVLPVMFDCGTDNPELLNDPFYLGLQQPRLKGQEYYELFDEFMNAIQYRWPHALVQFEDFKTDHAQALLDKYRHRALCFNDDIQGTGVTTLAGLLSALRSTSTPKLQDQRIVVVGAGSAGIGVANQILDAMKREGLSEQDALERFWVLDQYGLIHRNRDPRSLMRQQRAYVRWDEEESITLEQTVEKVKPTVLLGLTGQGGIFTEEAIRGMASHVDKPIVFPLSNPTSSAECTAEQAYEWTDGRCVFASGSPFEPVEHKGKTLRPSQCNNMFVFPGVGLGASLVRARGVTDDMLHQAAVTLAHSVSEEEISKGMVFPSVSNIRDVSRKVGAAVARTALADGIARYTPPAGKLEDWVGRMMYEPEYAPVINDVY